MIPETLYNCNTFVDGRSYAGRATSMTPPKLKIKTDDFRAGGMDAAVKIDQGMEPLDASFAMATMEYEVLRFFGLVDQGAFNGVFRAVFMDRSGKTKSAAVYLRGMLYEVDPGDWKPGDKVEAKFSVSCDYYKLEVAGVIVHEIDIFACKRVINGVDQLAEVRKGLGM
ncbi:phage major tail tube protein [Burkholderia sp. lyk4-R2A-23]|uniref:phage major tail tube protein n=1 Tax=Burkholderia sp. lyk4-R2A-23 TaxID=3040284 RepID=UPI00254F9426|nr:phage major tail tube protein [Burkholderia sp. lyk4-R2A-23]